MLTATLVKVIRISQRVKNMQDSKIKSFRAQRRIGIFLVALLFMFIMVLEYRVQLNDGQTLTALQSARKWGSCKIKTDLGFPDAGICPEDRPNFRISYTHNMVETIIIAAFGIVAFLCFGTDKAIYVRWRNISRMIYNKEWGNLKKYIAQTEARSATLTTIKLGTSSSEDSSFKTRSSDSILPPENKKSSQGSSDDKDIETDDDSL
eukprot:TRINITY_DN10207_c0_g1_i2.p1 TRINITY_DN10207_c0_g1~~TRINITY_DN10207_c0_g1_i2.p1  ORF type:complete len:206 (-),score=27.63 TRINITY_DN10207_c0_g1_i2:74-691(-)